MPCYVLPIVTAGNGDYSGACTMHTGIPFSWYEHTFFWENVHFINAK